jgi:hypothetical protein
MVGHVVQRKEKMGEGGGVWMEADSLNSTFSEKKKKKKEKQTLKTNQTDPTSQERAPPVMTSDHRWTFPMEPCSVVPLLPLHRTRKKRKMLCLAVSSLSPVVATTAERKRRSC